MLAHLSDDLLDIIWTFYIQELRTRCFHRYLTESALIHTCDVFNLEVDASPILETLFDARSWIHRRAGYGMSNIITYRGMEDEKHLFSAYWIIIDDTMWFGRDDYVRSPGDQGLPVYHLIDLTSDD